MIVVVLVSTGISLQVEDYRRVWNYRRENVFLTYSAKGKVSAKVISVLLCRELFSRDMFRRS